MTNNSESPKPALPVIPAAEPIATCGVCKQPLFAHHNLM